MKKIEFDRFGPPSKVVKCVSADKLPPPQDWEVTVEITAAAINPSDVSVLRGQYGKLPSAFPAPIGLEAVGKVVAAGTMIEDLKPGDRVLLIANDNWVQRRNVSAKMVLKLPDWMDDIQASMVKVNAGTALAMLERVDGLQEGDYILQTAPLSAVGRMIIAFAKARGLKSVNIVRRETAIAEVEALGGDFALVHTPDLGEQVAAATGGAKINVAFDAVAGPGTEQIADCLNNDGLIVNYGMLSGEACSLRADHTIFKNIRLEGFWLLKLLAKLRVPQLHKLFADIFDLLEKTQAKSDIAGTFTLDQIADAIEASEASGRKGKVILTPNGPVLAAGGSVEKMAVLAEN